MSIDIQSIAMGVISVACAVIGWLSRELWEAVKKLRTDLSALEIRIGTDYVRYDRLQDAMRPIMQALDDIRDRLDHKADK